MRRSLPLLLLLAAVAAAPARVPAPQAPVALPGAVIAPAPEASVRFAVIGDNGTGDTPQRDIGRQMAAAHARSPFDVVLMLGDNTYGRTSERDLVDKFEVPYKPLLDAGVRFYATLGNHDDPQTRFYRPFNMGGERYYTYTQGHVRFVVVDTNVLDAKQLVWLDTTLAQSPERWKIVYFHHAIYSNGSRHGSNVELRVRLEPLLVRHGVNVVFSGHDHHYERFKPQKGITYFVEGASGKLRKGIRRSELTAAAFDREQTFMVVDIAGDELVFQTISRSGAVIDSGAIRRQPDA